MSARHQACIEISRRLKYTVSTAQIVEQYISITLKIENLIGLEDPKSHTGLTHKEIELFLDISNRWCQNLRSSGLGWVEIGRPEVFEMARRLKKELSDS